MIYRLLATRGPLYGTSVLFLLTFTLQTSHGSDQVRECVKFFVGGSIQQPQLSGHYTLLKRTFNNRLVYTQTCSQYALFVQTSKDGSTRWVIGKGVGDDVTIYVKSHDTRAYPRDVDSWMVWSRANETWIQDSEIYVTCVDAYVNKHCRSVVASGPHVPVEYRGPYVIDGFHNNHVKYKNAQGSLYLYHHDDSICRRWIVGPNPGRNIIAMQSLSNSSSPFEVSEKWMIAQSGELSLDTYTVQIECMDYAEDPDTLTCGQKSRNNGAVPYMFGSATSYAGKWPFMVSYVRADGAHKCGASLIGRRWVITAGHCVSAGHSTRETLKLGAYDLENSHEQHVQTVRIKAVHIHPMFTWVLDPFRLNYDVALIELDRDVIYTEHIQPACLPPQREEFPFNQTDTLTADPVNDTYTHCYMVGWGKTNYISAVGGKLQEVKVTRAMHLSECYDTYYHHLSPLNRNSTTVCLFGRSGGRMCKGDSGSPLFCQRNGQWSLLGLGGWSVAQCIDMYFFFPSVYTDLSIFRDWIIAVMHGTD